MIHNWCLLSADGEGEGGGVGGEEGGRVGNDEGEVASRAGAGQLQGFDVFVLRVFVYGGFDGRVGLDCLGVCVGDYLAVLSSVGGGNHSGEHCCLGFEGGFEGFCESI